jgi:hypothetical protein
MNYTLLLEQPDLLQDVAHHLICDLLNASGASDNDGSVSLVLVRAVGLSGAADIPADEIFTDGDPTCPYTGAVALFRRLVESVLTNVSGSESGAFATGLTFDVSYDDTKATALQSALADNSASSTGTSGIPNTLVSFANLLSVPSTSLQTQAVVQLPTNSTPVPTTSGSSKALFGGIVGGVAAVGLIVLFVLLYLWHRKPKDDHTQPPHTGAVPPPVLTTIEEPGEDIDPAPRTVSRSAIRTTSRNLSVSKPASPATPTRSNVASPRTASSTRLEGTGDPMAYYRPGGGAVPSSSAHTPTPVSAPAPAPETLPGRVTAHAVSPRRVPSMQRAPSMQRVPSMHRI